MYSYVLIDMTDNVKNIIVKQILNFLKPSFYLIKTFLLLFH